MVKKLLSILLVVALLIPTLALAEGTVYTNDDPYYSYTYPEGWKALTKDTVDSIIDLGTQVVDNAMISSYVEQVKTAGLVMFTSSDMSNFAVVLPQPLGIDMSSEQLITVLKPVYEQQFQSIFPDAKTTNEGEVLRKGDNEFAKLSFTLPQAGVLLNMSIYSTVLDTTMYVFMYMSLTGDASVEAMFEETLASFTTVK